MNEALKNFYRYHDRLHTGVEVSDHPSARSTLRIQEYRGCLQGTRHSSSQSTILLGSYARSSDRDFKTDDEGAFFKISLIVYTESYQGKLNDGRNLT